jgi:AcrR family transcriptional regulator
MTLSRDAYHHGDLRNALVAAAVRLIEEGGPAAFSLREAAREVGVSANAAYRHFDDKSALMTAVATHGFEQLASRMLRAMDRAARGQVTGPISVARFKAVGRAYVEFAGDRPELFRVMFGTSGAECREAGDSPVETPWALLGKALDALVDDGLLAVDRRPGAELKAWSVVHGFASLALDGVATQLATRERKAALEALLEFAVVGLCGEVPRRRGTRAAAGRMGH